MSSKLPSPPASAPAAALNPAVSPATNPAEIAREAFRRLATRRIAPTPNAYRDIYNEIAGISEPVEVAAPAPAAVLAASAPPDNGAENVLSQFAAKMSESGGELGDFGRRFQRALKARDWDSYARTLAQLSEKQARKGGGIELPPLPDGEQTRTLRELLSRTLGFAVATLLTGTPALVEEAESLGAAIKQAHTEDALNEAAVRLKQLCYQIELKSGDTAEQQELLLR